MTFDYAEMAGVSLEMLTEFGQELTLRKTVIGAYDPNTGVASTTVKESTRIGAVFDYYNNFFHGEQFTSGIVIESGDMRCYLDANGDDPNINDQLIIGGVTWNIKNAKTIAPSGVSVLHDLHIRR